MAETDWNDVGDRFNRLGRALQGRWSRTRSEAGAAADEACDEVRSAMQRVNESLDDLAAAITHTVNDDEVRDAATSAAGGLIEAISSSLDDLAGRIQHVRKGEDLAPGATPPRSGEGRTDV